LFLLRKVLGLVANLPEMRPDRQVGNLPHGKSAFSQQKLRWALPTLQSLQRSGAMSHACVGMPGLRCALHGHGGQTETKADFETLRRPSSFSSPSALEAPPAVLSADPLHSEEEYRPASSITPRPPLAKVRQLNPRNAPAERGGKTS
jgi:hypothetical protein